MFSRGVFSKGVFAPGMFPPGATSVPVADFSGTPTSGHDTLNVTFTDLSTNAPTSWLWLFGDGVVSTLQNPTHFYSTPGIYTVSLTATNAGGSDTKTKIGYVSVAQTVNATGGGGGGGGYGRMRNTKAMQYKEWVAAVKEVKKIEAQRKRKRRRVLALAIASMWDDE